MTTNANPPARQRTIDQVVAELKMLAGRQTLTRQEKFRFAVDANNILISMTKDDWDEFRRERALCLKTGPTASGERSPESL